MEDLRVVEQFYDEGVAEEWGRLKRHPIEFEINLRFLKRYIRPGQRVLDVGGGPGRYSLHFAEMGCDVTHVDLSGGSVAFVRDMAKRQGVNITSIHGDAREVDRLVEGEFDHVLLMGPLYHLSREADQRAAIDACLRVLKPGGTLSCAFISSYAGIIFCLRDAPWLILDESEREGFELFINDRPFAGKAFTQAYFIRHADAKALMASFPALSGLHFLGSEGMLAPVEDLTMTRQHPDVLKAWIDLQEKVCEREDLLGYAEHFLYIGRKEG